MSRTATWARHGCKPKAPARGRSGCAAGRPTSRWYSTRIPIIATARRVCGGCAAGRPTSRWYSTRVILRHVPEPSAQRLLLERGDVDIARDLTPDLIVALDGDEEIAIDSHPRGTLIYLAANQGHPVLGKPQVVQALRHAVDYHGMVDSFLAGQFIVH